MNEKFKDILVATVPLASKATAECLATLTLDDWNNIAGITGALLGSGYVIWKWRRDAKRGRRKLSAD